MIVLLFIVAGLVAVQLAAKPNAGPALWVMAALCAVAMVIAVIVHRLDRTASAKGLSNEDIDAVNERLKTARDRVATRLEIKPIRCRANVFGENPFRRLQLIRALRVNMDEQVLEWDISIPSGRGGTGIAWATGRPKVLLAPFVGDYDLDPDEAERVDPELEWIISVPVKVDDAVKWVVNIDGKDPRTRPEVEGALQDVVVLDTALKPYARKA